MKIRAYLLLEQLPDKIKEANKIKVKTEVPRYDCTAMTGRYLPLECLKNNKGQLYFYLSKIRNVNFKHKVGQEAAVFLQASKDSFNFSSIFILVGNETTTIGYGTPNSNKYFSKDKLPNPFTTYGDDGYLFLINHPLKIIEVLIIDGGKSSIKNEARELALGNYNEMLNFYRTEATPVYNYTNSKKIKLSI